MKQAALERYRFSGFHRSHIGAVKSCLDYFDIRCSAAWVYGMTGSAFITVVDEALSAPNIGEPEEEMFALARHLGVDIKGWHTFADAGSFARLQREAWDTARFALDKGLPVFAKELDLGNETSVIYAYDDAGYFTYSWHGGNGHEGADDVIPWTMLGRNYCPCAPCLERRHTGEWPKESVYQGDLKDGGFISLHYASRIEPPSDEEAAVRETLRFASAFFKKPAYQWGSRTFYSGAAAYDKWIEAVRNNTMEGFFMGYYADLGNEARRYAYQFLKEASERFAGGFADGLAQAAGHYKQVSDAFRTLNDLFPWSQPRAPIEDPDRRMQAIELLERMKELEQEGCHQLERLGSE
ncbi:hypothetical protein [Paenibacillus thermotolerans]|uniref:hypothetical protein n=1 Tax=Paenibacillus thermotolerans TaxID=3027807 RepID=UPI0023684A3C|nr:MULTISPECIES: hypothetical protein [unclassified Paenibacillus]